MTDKGHGPVRTRRQILRTAVAGLLATLVPPLLPQGILGKSPEATSTSALQLEGGAEVVATDGGRLVARLNTGRLVTADSVGFPSGAMPRVGDIVGIDLRTAGPLCAPIGGAPTSQSPTAHPVTEWILGTPSNSGANATVAGVRLTPSPEVAAAATAQRTVWVATLATTLDERLVLAVRPG